MRLFINTWEYPKSKRKGKGIHRTSAGAVGEEESCFLLSPHQTQLIPSPGDSIFSIFLYLTRLDLESENKFCVLKGKKRALPSKFQSVKIDEKVSREEPGWTRRGRR